VTGPVFLDVAVRATLLMAIAWLAAAAVARAGGSAAMRHLVWLLGLAALPLLPLLSAAMPSLPLPVLPETLAAPPPGIGIAADPDGSSLGRLAGALYLAIATALLGRLLLGRSARRRLWSRAAPARDSNWRRLLADAGSTLGLGRAVALRLAEGPVMPMTWGSLGPRILLPAEARAWPEALRRSVLLHELAHISRRDSLTQAAGAAICALYWFHPGVWYAAGRMRAEQEQACDDLVLTAGTEAGAYARNLLDVAATLSGPRLATKVSVAMAGGSQLELRLRAILGGASRRAPGPAFVGGCGAFAVASTLFAAAAAPVAAVDNRAARPPVAAPAANRTLLSLRRAEPAENRIHAAGPTPRARPAPRNSAVRAHPAETHRGTAPATPPSPLSRLGPLEPLPPVPAVEAIPAVPAVPVVPPVPPMTGGTGRADPRSGSP
jgi:beta-lactamase regulating signal transducer with metallopeptidase domain